MFGSSSSLPPLISEGGGLMCESVGKADLLSDHFDSKQYREGVDLPLTCHPSPSLTTFAFRSSEVRHIFLDLDPYSGTDPLGMFPLFIKRTADVMARRLSVVFRRVPYCRVHLRVDRRLGSCRLTSVQLLIGSTIWAFSISSVLWVLEVLSCLY